MPVARTITVVEDTGAGTVTREETISSTEFAVKLDGVLYSPEITTEVEMENDGDISNTADQCGNTEREKINNGGWNLTVQGVVTGNDDRHGNLSLQLLRDVIAPMDTIRVRSDIAEGEFEVSNTVITQTGDLVSVETKSTDGEEKAFEFQLQLGESSADN